MEHESASGYSIWLMPDGSEAPKLTELIYGIAQKYDAMTFEPHVTLIGSIKGKESDLLAKTKKINQNFRPLRLDFENLLHMDSYFKCVFIKMKKNEELNELHRIAEEEFGLKASDFDPHLSLIYAHIGEKERKDIIKSLDPELFSGLKRFYSYKLHLYSTTGKVSDWHEIS